MTGTPIHDSVLAGFLAGNEAYLVGHAPAEGGLPQVPLAVVACADPRLNPFVPDCLGVRRDQAVIVRNAGGTVTDTDQSVLRSLCFAVLRLGVRNIVVLGHTHCGMTTDVLPLSDAMAARGVPRSAVPGDLHGWFGLFVNPEANVRAVLDRLAHTDLIPADVGLYGFVLDLATGRIQPVDARPAGQRRALASEQARMLPDEPHHVAGPETGDPAAPSPRDRARLAAAARVSKDAGRKNRGPGEPARPEDELEAIELGEVVEPDAPATREHANRAWIFQGEPRKSPSGRARKVIRRPGERGNH